MKKIIILAGLILLLQMPLAVYAKTDNNKGSNNQPSTHASETAREKSALGKLNRIIDETDDPEIEEEVEAIAEEQEQVEEQAEEAIQNTSERPAAVRFLIGPDYKNLGQLRSEVVHTRNNIRKLEKVLERASEEDQPAIEAAVLELEESALKLQTEIYTKLADFSLFGWLFRWLSGFTPPEEEVTPTMTPTVTQEVTATPTPEVTVEVTITPTITAAP